MADGLRIGEVAANAGVNVQTLRFYERRGLLKMPARRESGYREYQPEAVDLVRFIKQAQTLGFSLDEVAELLTFREGRGKCADVRRAAEEKIADIDHKLERLAAIRAALATLVATCSDGNRRECAIIEALNRPNSSKLATARAPRRRASVR